MTKYTFKDRNLYIRLNENKNHKSFFGEKLYFNVCLATKRLVISKDNIDISIFKYLLLAIYIIKNIYSTVTNYPDMGDNENGFHY